MKDTLKIAADALLNPANLYPEHIFDLQRKLQKPGVDFADFYFQHSESESWLLEDGIVKNPVFGMDRGVGVRAISGTKTGFAYCDEITLPALKKAIAAASSIIDIGQEKRVRIASDLKPGVSDFELYSNINPLANIKEQEKAALLKDVYAEIIRLSPDTVSATVSLTGSYVIVLVSCNEYNLVADIRPLARMDVSVTISKGSRREKARSGGGGRFGYEFFLQNDTALKYAHEAIRIAQTNLDAIPAPAGNMPVVLGPGWPGVLLHEAVGHGLEADFNRKGSSIFSGRIGEKVASGVCNIVDNGKLSGGYRGSLNIDDEGTPTQCTTLIENGILRAYMQDRLNAHLLNMKPTGNGRRESYSSIPLPRMTNTYMLPGKTSPEEILSSVSHGLFAVNFSSGQVDITSGNFVFTTSEAYLIENGKVTRPVKEAALIGNGPEVLKKISMVGDDLALDLGVGTCGKEGQSVPVCVGQPTLKVDELTIGGTADNSSNS